METLKRFNVFDDLQAIVELGLNEDLRLEYKASKVLAKSDIGTICKAVSAFANSAGGQFVVGIQVDEDSKPQLDGGVDGVSKRDWLHRIINANTHPPVDDVEVVELIVGLGTYYILTIPVSTKAPHQAADHRYYKRRGSLSEPMEHYEVEDVRNRPKDGLSALEVALAKDDSLAFLRLRNVTRANDVTEITCEVTSNVDYDRRAFEMLASKGIRRLPPGEELHFIIGGIGMLLHERRDAEISVAVTYTARGQRHTETQTFYFAHYNHSIIFREPTEKALLKIEEQLKAITKQLQTFVQHTRKLESISDASGLRISQRTLMSLRGEDYRFDPREFDVVGYKIILDLSWAEAHALSDVFHSMITPAQMKKGYDALPGELRDKFEHRFSPSFAED